MKTQVPFNAGDLVVSYHGLRRMVVGHVWWPVERTNAYYCLPINEYGEVTSEEVEYMWDSTHEFSLYTPKAQAA